ncbi:hypothetical protein R9C00_02845 [Flammeovirgaceae bacterium SG7u.111]|nr:hypothetical protein [Flammeovirgaceae bacterium SG7u.132]WPO36378.1 hypothetical protein R9C00_02845 [Flammeovirgaceae bacterium SG7u.111]
MKVKSFLALAGALLFSFHLMAQSPDDGWNWGSDPGTAKEKNVLYNDAMTMGDFEGAVAPFEWLLTNTPDLNKAIYINGVKLYNELLDKAEKAKDEEKVRAYQDKIMSLYEDRMKYYGEEADITDRMGRIAYFYWKDRKDDAERWPRMLELYSKAVELKGNDVYRNNLIFLMLALVNNKKNLTETEILEQYDKMSEIIEYNIKNDPKPDAWKSTQDKIDGLLSKVITIDCEFVRTNFKDKVENNPEDIKTSKRAFKYMLADGCTDDPLFLKAAENIFDAEPDAGIANYFSKKYLKDKEYDKSIEWKQKALELAGDDAAMKGEIQMDIAKVYGVQGRKSQARAAAYEALKADPNLASEVYSYIGDLYFTSGNDCKEMNPVKARAVYLAAYDMYQKAGNSSKMAQARAQFPSMGEIFTATMSEGDAIEVGCWINTTTTIRKRPKE